MSALPLGLSGIQPLIAAQGCTPAAGPTLLQWLGWVRVFRPEKDSSALPLLGDVTEAYATDFHICTMGVILFLLV